MVAVDLSVGEYIEADYLIMVRVDLVLREYIETLYRNLVAV